MTRLFLITLLVLSSGPVYAEWVAITIVDDGISTIYVDRGTIRRKGNMVKWWVLMDYKTVQTGPDESFFSSFKSQREYDCAEDRARSLAFTYFSGNMGSGKVVHYDFDGGEWEPVEPGSVGHTLWKLACAMK